MDNQHATEILRLFEEFRQAVESKEDKRWRWRDGTLLFPEGRCCYCGQPVRSNRLWVIEGDWLRGQLRLDEGKAVFERPEHPHSGTDGVLCTGGHDVLTALFFGINPGDVVRRGMNIRTWYRRMFGHDCKAGEQLKAADGIFTPNATRRPDRRPNCGCGCGCNPNNGPCGCDCGDCNCDYFTCVVCDDRYSREERRNPEATWEDWCTECFGEQFINCEYCGAEQGREQLYEATEQTQFCMAHLQPEQRGLAVLAEPIVTTTPPAWWRTAFEEQIIPPATPPVDRVRDRLRELRDARTARLRARGDGTYTIQVVPVPIAEAQEQYPPVREAAVTAEALDAAIARLARNTAEPQLYEDDNEPF